MPVIIRARVIHNVSLQSNIDFFLYRRLFFLCRRLSPIFARQLQARQCITSLLELMVQVKRCAGAGYASLCQG
jgi:hypothetical protein